VSERSVNAAGAKARRGTTFARSRGSLTLQGTSVVASRLRFFHKRGSLAAMTVIDAVREAARRRQR
jgi:hypothetical protein